MALRLSVSCERLYCVLYGRSLRCISRWLARDFSSDENNSNNDADTDRETGWSVRIFRCRDASDSDFMFDPDRRLPLPGRIGPVDTLLSPPAAPTPIATKTTSLTPSVRRAVELTAQLHEHGLNNGASLICANRDYAASGDADCDAVTQSDDAHQLQISVHQCSEPLKNEFSSLFSERRLSEGNLTVLLVNQRTEHDMALWSEEAEQERTEMADHFMSMAHDVTSRLRRLGFWAEVIDPRSGRPSRPLADSVQQESDALLETDDRLALLGVRIEDLGCCRVVQHPDWNSHVFVGCMFTDAAFSDERLSQVLRVYHRLPDAPAEDD